jgi:thiamine-phosphate pyrophosphorylase
MSRPTFRLLAISQLATLGREPVGWFRELAAAGVDGVQIREKDLDDRALLDLARLARAELTPPEGTTALLVNGRLDVALAAGAAGAHLPAAGVPLAALRQRFGAGVLLGRSTHSLEEVERARRDGADYVTFGPVYATPGKAGYGPPAGLERLAAAARLRIPVYALGGVTLSRFGEVAAAGVAGVAAIRLFQDPVELQAAARAAREIFPGPGPL